MSRIAITRIDNPAEASAFLATEMARNCDDIRRRAFHHFERRGAATGEDLDDWFRAENEFLWRPHAEMFENEANIVLRLAVPGFGPESLEITSTPHCLLIESSEQHQHHDLGTRLRFCYFGERLFRYVELPERVMPATAAAALDRGILQIVATVERPAVKSAVRLVA